MVLDGALEIQYHGVQLVDVQVFVFIGIVAFEDEFSGQCQGWIFVDPLGASGKSSVVFALLFGGECLLFGEGGGGLQSFDGVGGGVLRHLRISR